MTKEITKDVIEKEYPNNKVRGKTFDERVELKNVEGFEMIDCKLLIKEGVMYCI